MQQIFAELPPYYSDEIKEQLIRSVDLEYMLPNLDNPDYQRHQVKKADGQVVGFGNGRMRAFDGFDFPKVGYIPWIGVAPSERGKGLGKRIVSALESGFREQGAPLSVAFIKDANSSSIRLFGESGYTVDSRIPSFDGGGGKMYSKPLV